MTRCRSTVGAAGKVAGLGGGDRGSVWASVGLALAIAGLALAIGALKSKNLTHSGAGVKTDSIFYELFQQTPELFFELVGQETTADYRFDSIEVKQTAFRVDGVFLPAHNSPAQPVYFVEVQFYPDENLYHRLFGEVFTFLRHHPDYPHWRTTVIFSDRNLEQRQKEAYQVLLDSHHTQLIFLDELPDTPDNTLSVQILKLIIEPQPTAPERARQILEQVPNLPQEQALQQLIQTIMVYKFPQLSREEIVKMLGLATSFKETRVYQEIRQEALEEGRQEGRLDEARSLILKLLTRRIGSISPANQERIEQLSLQQLQGLGEALLEFNADSDLETWLSRQ